MFLPVTKKEATILGWKELDVILVTGDAYIDSPLVGVAIIGKVLLDAGFSVGVISQPRTTLADDIRRLGEPRVFWGVTGGCVDSMVANRTALGKPRRSDDFTPGGKNTARPNRAVITYANLIRRHFKTTSPIVLGGIEASLRRIAHYDFSSDRIRRSVLLDAKADFLLYGMADTSVVRMARALKAGEPVTAMPGLCHISSKAPGKAITIPSFEAAVGNKAVFAKMFRSFYHYSVSKQKTPLVQQHGTRYLIHNPPSLPLSAREMDVIYGLEFERDVHPFCRKKGQVKAIQTIRDSIVTHRGCFGECNFCSIAVHQGLVVQSRSPKSILKEARLLASIPSLKGKVSLGGSPTANMYASHCGKTGPSAHCSQRRCLFPKPCPDLVLGHSAQASLLRKLQKVPGIQQVIVSSGIRHDMVVSSGEAGTAYLREVVNHHTSGQLKVAPEHSQAGILNLMGKPGPDSLLRFRRLFQKLTVRTGKKQFLTHYLIAAHPGCRLDDMDRLRVFCRDYLGHIPEQVQVFTPTPSTYSTLMYWTGKNPFAGKPCFAERTTSGKAKQLRRLQRNNR